METSLVEALMLMAIGAIAGLAFEPIRAPLVRRIRGLYRSVFPKLLVGSDPSQQQQKKKRILMDLYDHGRKLLVEDIDSDAELQDWLQRVEAFDSTVNLLGEQILSDREWQKVKNVDIKHWRGSFTRRYNDEHEDRWAYLSSLVRNIDNAIDRFEG